MTDTHRCLQALKAMRRAYGALHDRLSDMIESGRLTDSQIPDDYHWLVSQLENPCMLADHVAKREIEGGCGIPE